MTTCHFVDEMPRLRELRRQAGMSQEALAAKAHLSHRTIARIEAGGDGKRPNRSTIALLAAALGITIEELLDANGGVAA